MKPFNYENPILFTNGSGFIETGKITETQFIDGKPVYTVQVLSGEITKTVTTGIPSNHLLVSLFPKKPPMAGSKNWITENMTQINEAFGSDMSSHLLVSYESQSAADADGMLSLFDDPGCCRKVLDRWVIVLS